MSELVSYDLKGGKNDEFKNKMEVKGYKDSIIKRDEAHPLTDTRLYHDSKTTDAYTDLSNLEQEFGATIARWVAVNADTSQISMSIK